MSQAASNPQVLHIGFSKCASTFLQAFFEDHPEIFLVNQSHYFSPFEFGLFARGRDWYQSKFVGAAATQVTLESDEHIVMPLFHPVLKSAATTLESVEEVANRIKATCDTTRIIMVVRSQAELIASRYSEYLLCGGKLDFGGFVEEQLNCSVDGVSYFQNFYYEIARRLSEHFGQENVLVLLQEELQRDEKSVIDRLCKFIGVSQFQPVKRDMASRRVGLSVLGMKIVTQFNKLVVKECKMSFKEAEVRIPFLLYKVLLRGYRYIDHALPDSIKGSKSSLLTPEIKRRVMQVFEDDNKKLAAFLQKDLSKLGYY